MPSIIATIDKIFHFWIGSHWSIALIISFVVNVFTYLLTSCIFSSLITVLVNRKYGSYIDNRPLKVSQYKWEIKYGFFACLVFSISSLVSRQLFFNVWPISLFNLVVQLLSFICFYEVYSYFIHRLLHSRYFRNIHSVHHKSIRITPFSAYSVHPIEAMFIAFSAPFFMLIMPISLALVFVLHISGMVFTIFLHSNVKLNSNSRFALLFNNYTNYHARHHIFGKFNFGFSSNVLDDIFRTHFKQRKFEETR